MMAAITSKGCRPEGWGVPTTGPNEKNTIPASLLASPATMGMEVLGNLIVLLAALLTGVFAFFFCLALSSQIKQLKARVAWLEQAPPGDISPRESSDDRPAVPPMPEPSPEDTPVDLEPEPEPADPVRATSVESAAPSGAEALARLEATPAHRGRKPRALEFGSIGRALDLVKTWVTSGNVPVKVGVLISLLGLGFLLGVALEQGWITLTIEVRHVLVAMFGVLLLVVGWRVRGRNLIYGLSLQGGGIAVLYLTTYVGYAVYGLMPASAASIAVVVVTVGAGVMAVLEDARSLAVLGIIGGFLAPVLAYSDAEDHVLVFGFYLILSAAIVMVTWFKTWPELNLLGLGFTLGVSVLWLADRYSESDWATTQPLIALLLLVYMTIPLLFAVRQPPKVKAWTTSPLIFGLPFVALGLQFILASHFEYGAAASAGVLAVIHALFGVIAHRYGKDSRSLRDAYWALSVAFVAITVPLVFGAQYTSVTWVLQGGVLVWFGLRQQRRLATYGGFLLQAMGGLAFILYLGAPGPDAGDLTPVLNGYFLGATLLAVVGLLSGGLLDQGGYQRDDRHVLTWVALVWGTGWWLFGGLSETMLHVPPDGRLSVSIVFVMVSLGGLAVAAPLIGWMRLRTVGVALLPALVMFLTLALTWQSHPLGMNGWVAWMVALTSYYLTLRWREDAFPWAIATAHTIGYWVVVILLGKEIYWQVDRAADGVWPITATLAALLAVVSGTLVARRAVAWPLGTYRRTYLMACALPAFVVVSVLALVINLRSDAAAPPITYLPLLNPLEIVTLLVVVVLLTWKRLAGAGAHDPLEDLLGRFRAPALEVIGVILLTMTVARTVHHWLDVPFDFDVMIQSTTLHASLSIVWGLAALSGMTVGVRLARRIVWAGGAALMGVVVVKLFLFDLSNTGTMGRVVSFLGVGLLLLVVGYFAPVPPSDSARVKGRQVERPEDSE